MRDQRTRLLLGGVCAVLLLMACEFSLPGPPGSADESVVSTPQADDQRVAGTPPAPKESGPSQGLPFGENARLEQMLPVFLAALGLVLFVVTGFGAFLLLRRRPRKQKPEERRAARGARTTAHPGDTDRLPERTVIGDGRYLVVRQLSAPEGAPVYEVEPTSATVLCARCYAPAASAARTCPRCSASLVGSPEERPRMVVRETSDPQLYAVSAELLADRLGHPSVILPVEVFADSSFGALRYYRVEPMIEARLAAKLRGPQPLDAVLDWGVGLARGLAYLHEHHVALDRVTPGQVIVQGGARTDGEAIAAPEAGAAHPSGGGNHAGWLCFDDVLLLPQGSDVGRVEREAANVRDLARLLTQWATGDDDVHAAKELPQGVKRTLRQAVGSHGLLRAGDFAVALERAHEQLARGQAVRFLVGKQTDVGHVRTLNEDSLWVLTPAPSQGGRAGKRAEASVAPVPYLGVFVVADGVGGHAAGDVASRLAVEAIADHGAELQHGRPDAEELDVEAWLARAARAANDAVYRERRAASNDMGCTLVMAAVVGRAATVLNVGDSRAYRLGPQGIRQITTDHSLVQRLIDIGQLTPEEARHHPQKSVIYRVIGEAPDLKVDLFDVVLASGEALLLCSDGLSDMVVDDEIWRVWRGASSPQAACDKLVALAKEAGGYDNITVVIAQIASA